MHRLRNQQRALWSLAALLLVALTAAFVILSWGVGPGASRGLVPESRNAAIGGLAVMIAMFVVYGIVQHRRLARLEDELRRADLREETMRARFEELEALFDASNELSTDLDLAGILDLAVRRIRHVMEADGCVIYLADHSGTRLLGLSAGAESGAPRHAAVVTPGEGVAGMVHHTGESMLVAVGPLLGQLATEMNLERAPGSGLCVPVRFANRALGVLAVARIDSANPYVQVHARMLESFAASLARSICGAEAPARKAAA